MCVFRLLLFLPFSQLVMNVGQFLCVCIQYSKKKRFNFGILPGDTEWSSLAGNLFFFVEFIDRSTKKRWSSRDFYLLILSADSQRMQ